MISIPSNVRVWSAVGQTAKDVAALKRIIDAMARDAVAARTEIEKLRFQLAHLKRAQFGRSLEKIERTVPQFELAIETLAEDDAQRMVANSAVAAVMDAASEQTKPARRPLPEHFLARRWFTRRHAAARTVAALCGGSAPM
jgi:hypothetical protein